MTLYNLSINADTFDGGNGNDVFSGPSGGADMLRGNGGNDTFAFRLGQTGLADGGSGRDTLHLVGNDYQSFDPGLKIAGIEKLVVDASYLDGTVDQYKGFTTIDVNNNSDEFHLLLYGKGGALDFSKSYTEPQKLTVDAELVKSAIKLTGSAGNDALQGGDFADTLNGFKGNDTLRGGAGDDKIDGGLGKDHLYGDDGKDAFVFDTKLGPSNVDHLGDFRYKDDSIKLDRDIFKWDGQHAGEIKASEFKIIGNGQQVDTDDHIIYNEKSGALYYDVDGKGGHPMVKFAVLDNYSGDVPTLTHHDIFLV